MFVRKKKNRSGSVSIVVVDKSRGRFREVRQFGVAHTEAEADVEIWNRPHFPYAWNKVYNCALRRINLHDLSQAVQNT